MRAWPTSKSSVEANEMRGITPYLQVRNTAEVIASYEPVFGAKEVRARLVAPDGTCMNAEIEMEGSRLMLADRFYGDRAGRVRDPFGHHWIIATRLREVAEEEMVAAFEAMFENT